MVSFVSPGGGWPSHVRRPIVSAIHAVIQRDSFFVRMSESPINR